MSSSFTMFCPLFLVLVLGEFFTMQTSAKFFIEVTRKIDNIIKLQLYECNYIPEIEFKRPGSKTEIPDTVIGRRVFIGYDLTCYEVTHQYKKTQIYSTANFYLVINPTLGSGKNIILENQPRYRYPAPYTFLLGVTISGPAGVQDYPAFMDSRPKRDEITPEYISSHDFAFAAEFLDEDALKKFVVYLNTASFEMFLRPSKELVRQFIGYGGVVEIVESLYTKFVRRAKQNKVDKPTQNSVRAKTLPALRFLIQKLIDPCLLMEHYSKDADAAEKRKASNMAKSQCHNYCKLLGASFSAFRVKSRDCGKQLVTGNCNAGRCSCEAEWKSYCTNRPSPHVYMIQCSNDLRLAIAAVKSECTSVTSWAGFRKMFNKDGDEPSTF